MATHVKPPGSNLGKTFSIFFFNSKLKISNGAILGFSCLLGETSNEGPVCM